MGLAASQNCFQIESNCRGDKILLPKKKLSVEYVFLEIYCWIDFNFYIFN